MRAETNRVRRALKAVGLEAQTSNVMLGLGARGLVVMEREKLLDEVWLAEQLWLLGTVRSMEQEKAPEPTR